ncbi:MAG: hypothetical protein FWG10_12030 [Eubacteriaceae bacterium]|nr:hypothetical protein [Eubacteriaceae bacterium]
MAKRATEAFEKCKTEKYFDWKIEGGGKIAYSLNEEEISNAERFDGLYTIRSNVPLEQMDSNEFVGTYKSFINVEQDFRK